MRDIKYLAVIPARAGSKRLPGKNIKLLNGKPLIAWTVLAATQSKYITEVIVSTDGEEIAKIAREFGATVPFLRPVEFASDEASSFSVIEHVLEHYRRLDVFIQNIVLLQPTSPLRNVTQIDEAISIFESKIADSVISVCSLGYPEYLYGEIDQDGTINGVLRRVKNKNQFAATKYRINGAIYIYSTAFLQQKRDLFAEGRVYPYIMNDMSSVDIDFESDFIYAEQMMIHRPK